jgi:N-acetylneuraminic acid mutarotase
VDSRTNALWKYNLTTAEWTWVSGTQNTQGAVGVYGAKGVASTSNTPGARTSMCTWIDSSDNIWVFGGFSMGTSHSAMPINDLWKFNPTTSEWTWIGGSNTTLSTGTFGVKGTPSALNIPSARYMSSCWKDTSGNFWVFGGSGYDSTGGSFRSLSDVWKFNPTSGEWTWVAGSSTGNQLGVYGSRPVFGRNFLEII